MNFYRVFLPFVISTLLNATSVESHLGIDVGMTSTKNSEGSHFSNPTLGLSLQYNNYVFMPRVDLEYVKLRDESAKALLKGSINGIYEFENSTLVTPYILAGVGYEDVQDGEKGSFESHPFIQAGGGVSIDLADRYRANLEGRFLQIVGGGNGEENEAIITAGLLVPLGSRVRDRRVVKAPVRTVKYIRPKVIISREKNECSIKINLPDFDRDGVEDKLDQCPATPCNFTVDRYGCPIKARLKINFATNSATITDESIYKVDRFANFLLKSRGSYVKIIGYTDSLGDEDKNLELSKRRANAVRRALIVRGISPSRLYAQGRGESMPIASNSTEEGRAENRRIEAEISYPKGRR